MQFSGHPNKACSFLTTFESEASRFKRFNYKLKVIVLTVMEPGFKLRQSYSRTHLQSAIDQLRKKASIPAQIIEMSLAKMETLF